MSYENDKAMYIWAAGESAFAAIVLISPAAKYIALMIGTMISDPAGMQKLADQWRDSKLGGESVDLGALEAAVADQKAKAETGGWKGEARQLFDSSSDTFLQEMNKLANHRISAGDTVEQTALIFHYGALVVFWAAKLMDILAGAALAATLIPVLRGPTQVAIQGALKKIGDGLVALIRMKKKGVLTAAGILGIVNMYSATQAQLFPALEAITDKTPDFGGAGFDHQSGRLVPSMDLSAAQPKGGLLGMF
ncbi:hypothetical protein [Streptosporangium sp. NPDC049644]|uniref:hypothetical protein n=1 Tax=Streptosporangium sp. NPDC049644 TaxID=3155507 RepID=UPI00342BBB21